MKKLLLRSILSCFVIAASLTACKKDKEKDVPPTKENLAGTYKITAISVNGQNISLETFAQQQGIETCALDDHYQINADFSAKYIDAGKKCDPAGDETTKWSLDGNKIKLIDLSGDIEKFTGNKLVIGASETDGGVTVKFAVTLEKV